MIELTKEQICSLESKYGLPLYLFNEPEFVENYRELEGTFREIYPDYHICYSYKTNYTPYICRLVKKLGGYAEVVSDMEYRLARELGYAPSGIVYNGPYKGACLEEHLLAGGINNIDRIEEAERICALAAKHPELSLKTGVRVNFDVDAGYTSRFGIDSDKLGEIIALLRKAGVTVNGLHCHLSRARGIAPWETRAEKMLALVERYALEDLDYISLGSGMFGKMDPDLKAQFPGEIPNYRDYALAVIRRFADYYAAKSKKPLLFTEPGTTLVSKYVDFAAKVEGIKTIRGKEFVLLNGSFHNLGETCQMKNLPIRIYASGGAPQEVKGASLVGYTCLEQDILYRDFSGVLSIGDYVLFGNVGGYSVVDKPPFIQPNCAMLALNGDGESLIKRRETYEDIFQSFCF